MKIFIGTKDLFGIELDIDAKDQNGVYHGYARLWFEGDFLGTFEDHIFLKSYLSNQLLKILNAPEFDDSKFNSSEEKFKYFMQRDEDINDEEVDKFKFNFGTMSDCFSIRAYRRCDELIILWKLWRTQKDIPFMDLKNYGNEVHEHRIQFSEFSKHVLFLDKILSIPDIR